MLLEPLGAREAGRGYVRRIGPEIDDRVAVDVGLEATEHFTDSTEGGDGLRHGGRAAEPASASLHAERGETSDVTRMVQRHRVPSHAAPGKPALTEERNSSLTRGSHLICATKPWQARQ